MKAQIKRTIILAAISTTALLTGCASMSPQECQTANWYEQGMRDGIHGEPRSRVEDHREACAKLGIQPDVKKYMAGRDIGIRQYCTPDVGMQEGLQGRSYRNSCPPLLEAKFLDRYRVGYRVYQAQQRVNQLDNEVNRKQRELDKARDDNKRARLRQDLRDLDRRLRDARNDVYYAERAAR